jgi:nitrous oxidase accessory protein
MRASLLITLILIIGSVQAAKITVGPADEDYPQIQKAIDNSTNGDVIEVHSGTYPECLNVFKAVNLIGVDTGDGLPVINANGLGSAITLMAPGSTVKGFNLTGSTGCACSRNAGIQVVSGNNTIIDNVIYRNKYGIYVQQGYVNNTFISNDLLENQIAARDQGGNSWNSSSRKSGGNYKVLWNYLLESR